MMRTGPLQPVCADSHGMAGPYDGRSITCREIPHSVLLFNERKARCSPGIPYSEEKGLWPYAGAEEGYSPEDATLPWKEQLIGRLKACLIEKPVFLI